MPLFLCDREFVSDQRWRVDMNEFYEELKKVLDLSDGDVWTETVLCGKDAGKKRILSGIFAQDEEQNERPDEKKKENREKSRVRYPCRDDSINGDFDCAVSLDHGTCG